MALLLIGGTAALTGTALYLAKRPDRSRYHSFTGEEDPRFDLDELNDPERAKSLTKYNSIDYPDILVGWRVQLADGRRGVVVNCKRRLMRATIFDIAFEGKSRPEAVVLNRKNSSNRRKYIDFELLSREF
jgi:hypothetical protein